MIIGEGAGRGQTICSGLGRSGPSGSDASSTVPRDEVTPERAAEYLARLRIEGCGCTRWASDVTALSGMHMEGADAWNADEAIVQAMLAVAGYRPGPIDGRFGPETGAALRAFQDANGLPSTGRMEAAVWTALQTAAEQSISRADVIDGEQAPSWQAQVVSTAAQTVAQLEALIAANPDLAGDLIDGLDAARAKLDHAMVERAESALRARDTDPTNYTDYQAEVLAVHAAIAAQYADDPIALAALDRAIQAMRAPDYLREQLDIAQTNLDAYVALQIKHGQPLDPKPMAGLEAEVERLEVLVAGAESAHPDNDAAQPPSRTANNHTQETDARIRGIGMHPSVSPR